MRASSNKCFSPAQRCKLADAFLWQCSYIRLKLAQLLGQVGVCLIWPARVKWVSTMRACRHRWWLRGLGGLIRRGGADAQPTRVACPLVSRRPGRRPLSRAPNTFSSAILCTKQTERREYGCAAPVQVRGPATWRGGGRVRSRCRFVLPRIHFTPDSRTYLVPLFSKQRCDQSLGGGRHRRGRDRLGARALPLRDGRRPLAALAMGRRVIQTPLSIFCINKCINVLIR
jgi:hypothetical protein